MTIKQKQELIAEVVTLLQAKFEADTVQPTPVQNEKHHSLFVESLMNTDRTDYLFEEFLNADKSGRLKLKQEVERIEQRLQQYKSPVKRTHSAR